MNMKTKDIIHLYLGAKAEIHNGHSTIVDVITGTTIEFVSAGSWTAKPILIPLNKLSDEQLIELYLHGNSDQHTAEMRFRTDEWIEINYKEHAEGRFRTLNFYLEAEYSFLPAQFKLLLSWNVDLFNLIAENEAIDASTLNPNPYDI